MFFFFFFLRQKANMLALVGHALETHWSTSQLSQSSTNISIISLVYHSGLRMLWKHIGQHPNNLKATPIYHLLVWFPIWSCACF